MCLEIALDRNPTFATKSLKNYVASHLHRPEQQKACSKRGTLYFCKFAEDTDVWNPQRFQFWPNDVGGDSTQNSQMEEKKEDQRGVKTERKSQNNVGLNSKDERWATESMASTSISMTSTQDENSLDMDTDMDLEQINIFETLSQEQLQAVKESTPPQEKKKTEEDYKNEYLETVKIIEKVIQENKEREAEESDSDEENEEANGLFLVLIASASHFASFFR